MRKNYTLFLKVKGVGKMSKHLDFIQGDNSGKKTKYFEVQSRFDSCDLGRIKWHSHWRQYIFEPCLDTIWSFDCLEDLSLFLKNLNLEHKQEVKVRKNANDDGIPPNYAHKSERRRDKKTK